MRSSIRCIIFILAFYCLFTIFWFTYTDYSGGLNQNFIQLPPSPENHAPTIQVLNRTESSLQQIHPDPLVQPVTDQNQYLDKDPEDLLQLQLFTEQDPPVPIQVILEESSEPPIYKPPVSSCKVHEPVFTESDYIKLFRFQKHPPCTTPTDDLIYLQDEKIFAQCVVGEPLFSIDPGLPQRLGGEVKDEVNWTSVSTLGPKSEYAFVKCGESFYSLFWLRFNQSAADRANFIRKSQKHDEKPMNVLVLVLDSLSRFTSYKYMPKLTEYLNERISNDQDFKDFSTYEFKRFGLPEIYTIPNIAQMIYGVDYEKMKKLFNTEKPGTKAFTPEHLEYQVEKSLWSYYSKLGYTTLFLVDTVWDFLNRFMGREIEADHVFQNYWRSAWGVYGYDDFSNQQRCMGRQNSHNLSFGYTYEYFEKYKDTNKFAYVHLNAPHDYSGNIQTVDAELLHFIKSLYKLMETRNENLVLYLMSDHGFKFDSLMFDLRSFTENTSPVGYLMISKEVQKKLKAKENLLHNSEMLTGRYDMNLVFKYLAHYPYEMPENEYFENIKKEYGVPSAVNLLTEKASPDRTCSDLGVAKNRCICSWYEPINPNDKFEMEVITKFRGLAEEYFSVSSKNPKCNAVESIELVGGERFNIHDMNKGKITFFTLKFMVNNNTKIEAKFNFCYENRVKNGMKKYTGELFPSLQFSRNKDTVFLQLTEMKVEGNCKKEKCIC